VRRLSLAVITAAVTISGLAVGLPAEAAVARPTGLAVAKGGVYHTGLTLQWKWAKKRSYQVQIATDATFSKVVADVKVAAKASKPSNGLMKTTIKNLPNATKLHLRARSITSSGAASAWSTDVKAATKVATPSKFSDKVTAAPGPKSGELTFRWNHDGKYTTSYQLETGLTLFSKTDKSLPRTGRHSRTFNISPKVNSFTLSAEQVASAGAPLGSGNHVLFRFSAINKGTAGTKVRRHPNIGSVLPIRVTDGSGDFRSSAYGSALRFATFNVRTAKATTDTRNWLQRADSVAQSILVKEPHVVALQELGPGRADGKSGTTQGTPRQTESLETALAARGGKSYQLVRTTPYVKAGTVHGTQGARILYDTSQVTLLSDCPEMTGSSSYSSSCSMELPILSDDSEGRRRSAAYAKFKDKATGTAFWFVSVHLDERHSATVSSEVRYNQLRGAQSAAVLGKIASLNTTGLPVIVGGDLNSWQNIQVGDAPKETLLKAGFVDSASAPNAINLQYPTVNHFNVTLKAPGYGYGPRLDGLFVKGGTPLTHENVTKAVDYARPSDHNLIVSDMEL
jgi:endonuclease/exonuclease/phosphatase family metal-dependent hydrolase